MEEVKEPNPSDSTWENKDSGSAALSLEKFFLISNEVLEGKRKISNFADYFKLASLHLHLHNLLLKTHKITNEYRFNVQQVDYFDILADEILQMILDEADFFSLINLSLCNKRLHKILCSEEGMRLKEQKFAEYMVPPAFRCSSSVKMLLLTIDLMKELQLVDLSLKDTILRYIHIVEDFEERLEEYRAKSGEIFQFDVSSAVYKKFGFSPGDKVMTPKGPAVVIGMNNTYLWFHIEGDSGASYWDNASNYDELLQLGIYLLQ